jgi:hypothetical protein
MIETTQDMIEILVPPKQELELSTMLLKLELYDVLQIAHLLFLFPLMLAFGSKDRNMG